MKSIKVLTISVTFVVFLTHSVWAQQIALTIDDAPWPNSKLYQGMERSQLLIQHLNEANVSQVVFFVNGKWADSQRGLQRVQMYAEAGHLIANHSYHHWDFDKVNATKYTQDILKAERVIENIPNFTKWYRSSMLHEGDTREKRDQLREFLKQHGYINGYVTVDNWDFYIEHLLQKGLKEGRQFNKNNLNSILTICGMLSCFMMALQSNSSPDLSSTPCYSMILISPPCLSKISWSYFERKAGRLSVLKTRIPLFSLILY